MQHSTPSSKLLSVVAALLIAAPAWITPGSASATPITSAANIPYSGISPGGVDMATGEIIIVCRPDLSLDGPFPVEFGRYYASMLAREGFTSSHLGPNWLGTYDWSLSATPTAVSIVTNRGQRIQFQQSPVGGWDLVSPTDERCRLDFVGGMWRFTHPGLRQVFLFDGTSHLLMQIVDEHGNALSLSYSSGRLSQVSDGLGRMLTFGYGATGLLIQVGDGTRSVSLSYTGGLLTGVADAGGHNWTYLYIPPDPCVGLLAGETEPLGNTALTQMYDTSCRVKSQTDALGGMAMYSYDSPSGNAYTDPLGHVWTYLHDAQNRLSSLSDPAGAPTSYAYDALGRPSMVARPMGDMTSLQYDPASGYPSMVSLADGSAMNWGYSSHSVGGATLFDLATAGFPDGTSENYIRNAAGNLADFTDQSGAHWMGTYNTRGQVLTATNPAGGVTTFTYDPQGRPATSKDNAGNTTSFTYDPMSRLTQVAWPDATHRNYAYDNLDALTGLTDERGKLWSYAYDANERLMTKTDPLLEATGFMYDGLDRVTQVVDPLSHATLYGYDPDGRLMSMTDRSGRMTNYQYDASNRLTGVMDPAGGTDMFSYDANSRMISAQDPLGHSCSFIYDNLDRVTHMTDPVGTGFDYGYDSMGRLHTATAPLGRMETFNYDPRGLLSSFFNATSETDFPRTALGEVSQVTDPNRSGWPRTYDPQGRMTVSADPLARGTTYEYDALSRVIHIGRPDGTVQQINYDAAGRVIGESFGGGPSLSYSYDDANRLISATGASFAYDAAGRMINSNGFDMTHDPEGRLLSETLAPGKVVSYSYDSRGLLSQVMDWMGGSTSFSYDAARRLTGITRPDGTSATYQYDAADRLINEVETRPGPVQISSITITRDALGQPTSIDRRQPLMPGATMPSSSTRTYDPASQLNGVSHDPLGRTTGDAARAFQWDGASRLTHYVAGADSPQYAYDAFGQQLGATQSNSAVAQAWNYGRGYPTNDDMQVQLPTPRTRYWVRAPSGLLLYGVDGLTGARSVYHYDESGNTAFLTNDGGSVVTEYAYTPYGGVSAVGETADNAFTYGGAEGATQLGGSGSFRVGGGIYDAVTSRTISGNAIASGPGERAPGPTGRDPGPPGSPGSWVELNPQPFPPGASVALNPQPYPPGASVALNPQPYPPGSWLTRNPGPSGSPGSWVELNPQPYPPGASVALNPQPYLPGMLVTPILGQTKNEVFSHHPAAAFEIKDFSFGVENPTTIGSATGGAGAGKIKFNEFQIKKTTDRASPIFFNYVCAGAHGSKVKVGMRKAGGDPSSAGKPYLSYKVATVFTTRIDWSGPGDEGPEESVTFVYGKFGVKYNSQKNDGSSPNSGWDSKPQPADLASTACMWCVP